VREQQQGSSSSSTSQWRQQLVSASTRPVKPWTLAALGSLDGCGKHACRHTQGLLLQRYIAPACAVSASYSLHTLDPFRAAVFPPVLVTNRDACWTSLDPHSSSRSSRMPHVYTRCIQPSSSRTCWRIGDRSGSSSSTRQSSCRSHPYRMQACHSGGPCHHTTVGALLLVKAAQGLPKPCRHSSNCSSSWGCWVAPLTAAAAAEMAECHNIYLSSSSSSRVRVCCSQSSPQSTGGGSCWLNKPQASLSMQQQAAVAAGCSSHPAATQQQPAPYCCRGRSTVEAVQLRAGRWLLALHLTCCCKIGGRS
jgi:hypothetical protein